jgi:hypothetical protein
MSAANHADTISDRVLDGNEIQVDQRREPAISDLDASPRGRPQSCEPDMFNDHGDELRKRLERVARIYAKDSERDGASSAHRQTTLVYFGTSITEDWTTLF